MYHLEDVNKDQLDFIDHSGEVSGYLYLMYEDSRKLIKIGVSSSPPRREQQLNSTKMPYKVRLIKQIKSPYYKKAERLFHKMYHKQRLDGEWFDLDPVEVTCFMLLTADHLEELCTRRVAPMKSLTELIEGSREAFLESRIDRTELEVKNREMIINSLRDVIDDLKSDRSHLENELRRMREQTHSNLQNTENKVRMALRSLSHLPSS